MKRVSLLLLVAIILVGMAAAPLSARPGKHKARKHETKISKFVCWLVTPWPLRDACRSDDSDGDGVVDRLDRCPATPRGAVVDTHGCPIDSDGDGVYDGIDKCPDTPKKVKVDTKGCPMDSDRDGVYDGIDKCPDTPKKAKVDTKGCPKDSDKDGVYDGIDECPDTDSDLAVDKKGCPIEHSEFETQLLDAGMISCSNILFETNESAIKRESYKVIDEIGEVLVQWPKLEIEIGGHTDSQGSDAFNQKLSEERAQAVLDYLVKKFPKIERDNLTVKGYGEGMPIETNDTAEGRMKNRRVEFKCMNKDVLKREIERKGYKRK